MVPKLPPLPPASSWYPGHMALFAKNLPQLLSNTHVVLEARDARLPLTSINPNFEEMLEKWRKNRGGGLAGPVERVVVYNKVDLVPKWGVVPFERALSRHFDHKTIFTTAKLGKSMGSLHKHLTDIARTHGKEIQHLNVLVVGMPNVGKSTILNHLRSYGIKGARSNALKTSRLPGMTRATSNRMRLCDDPLIYSIDSPGVMLPFLGYGDEARERAVKISLILAMKESLFDYEQLAAYLLFRLNSMNPKAPPYPALLSKPKNKQPVFPYTDSIEEFLQVLATRMGYLLPGGVHDTSRAAKWFVEWWRGSAAEEENLGGTPEWGWGLDCQWVMDEPEEMPNHTMPTFLDSTEAKAEAAQERQILGVSDEELEWRFDTVIKRHLQRSKELLNEVSETQVKKREKEEAMERREQKRREMQHRKA
ncbi:SubName: Full=Uncharacterized protein {ECO:0000313/EMBL:CCA70366.1} [Serendipita indica DSM 11827]|uniref:G domain-containing protein n=1 Tax=Serendipita indica (strain DSM 11827) TaxID=1109443 RepID=G4TGB6_SERID|nr:SubName: Full=Uncharacterized protein {ECO:0000313/EMBL:CCA70366.1} [Serendipita indica DSM 11827]CCA70366.1 hypothetical protein PIIN_04305 [Serendipita indica DSM 11827]